MNWKRAVLAALFVVAAVLVLAPTSNAGLCDLFHRSAAVQSAGSSGGTYVAAREVRHVHTYSYGSSGGVPTQVLVEPRSSRLFGVLRRQHTVLIEPTQAVSATCDCNCPNCNCNGNGSGKAKPPVDAKKE